MRAGDVVSLRVATPAGPTEVVGTLVAASQTTLTVRRRDGRTVDVAVDDVRAGRVVPPGPARTISADDLQAVMVDGWRPIERERLGSWLLRAAGGFTGRGNSALVTAAPVDDVAAALDAVRDWYAARSLPARLQVVLGGEPPGLTDLLTRQGWSRSAVTHAMTAEAAHVLAAAPASRDASVAPAPDAAWLALYRPDEGPLIDAGVTVLTSHPLAGFVSLRDADGTCSAITRTAVDGRWAGLFCVEVDRHRRREGLGSAVVAASLRWAVAQGARRAYLQVMADNSAGVALWNRLGFAVHHDYVYLTAPEA